MLSNFRNSIYGLLTKFLLAIVILSLVVWGVGTNTPSRDNYVVRIDNNHYIYTDKFNQQRKNFVHSIVQMNPNIALDNLNVDSLVLNSMIRNKILELEYQRLGIFVSDNMAKNEISKNRFFFDKEGKFDRNLFKRIVINQGMTEKDYVAQQKMALASQIFESAIIPFTAPASMVQNLYQYQNQDRKIHVIHITPQLDKNTTTPPDEEIQRYYESHQKDFTTNELRDIEFIKISPQNFNKSEAPEKAMHNAIKDIEDLISSGESLPTIAKKYNLTHQKIDKLSSKTAQINNIKSGDMPKFISLAFEGDDENSPSDAVQLSSDSNDYYIFNTKTIYPSRLLKLDQVRSDIIKILGTQDKKILLKSNASMIYRKFITAPHNLDNFIKNNKTQVSQETITVTRGSTKIVPTLLEESFNLNHIGAYTNMIQDQNGKFVFAILDKVIVPPANNIAKQTANELNKTIAEAVNTATHNELMRYFYGRHTIEVKQMPQEHRT